MLKFSKMHGLGNDFVVIDAIFQHVSLTARQIRFLADRHFGIGCDQVLLVEPPRHANADFCYRIFNADGGEVAQCGNGARCIARFVRDKGLCAKDIITVDTGSGQLELHFDADGMITVNMGVPRHAPREIPLNAETESKGYTVTVNGIVLQFGAVSMGNPHAVFRVDGIEKAPVDSLGPILEQDSRFPDKANIGFMAVAGPSHIRLRVYERGAAETLACGSGACAAAVVGIDQGILKNPVQVDLPGGSLKVIWKGRGQPVYMTGPAVSVFDGTIDI